MEAESLGRGENLCRSGRSAGVRFGARFSAAHRCSERRARPVRAAGGSARGTNSVLSAGFGADGSYACRAGTIAGAMIGWPTRSDAAKLSDEQLLEKLHAFGLEVDRDELERLCEGALSVEEVALPLLDRCGAAAGEGRPHEDWMWLCLLELWRRWWPERVCVEFLGDKIQAGYDALERREAASAAAVWLDAWSDVVRLCDLSGIDSIREFDDRFSMYQSLFNWSQDLEDALGNAGREGSRVPAHEDRGVRGGAAAVPGRARADGGEPPPRVGGVVLRARRDGEGAGAV